MFHGSGSGLDQLMTPEEKEKLYTAIGYSGSSHNLTLPKQVPTSAHDALEKSQAAILQPLCDATLTFLWEKLMWTPVPSVCSCGRHLPAA